MIFARDKSQMCNNLLQYAHVYAWGREHNRKVISMRFSYKYQYFRICHTSLTNFGLYLFAKYMAALRLLPTFSFKHDDCDVKALEEKMLRHRHFVVSGWHFRFYDLFLKYRDEICDLFKIDSEYTESVRQNMQTLEQDSQMMVLRLGVHIRRGDYARWAEGRYFYDDKVYARHINKFVDIHPDKEVHAYLSTNDNSVTEENYSKFCPKAHVHFMQGNPPEDLFMLSECDALIGPPSTFSLVAAMYRDIPLYRMDTDDEAMMSANSFKKFDYWFRRIV